MSNQRPLELESVTSLKEFRVFLDRYEKEIFCDIELPAVHSAYWFANRGQFKELLDLDAELTESPSLRLFSEESLCVGRQHLRMLKPMYDQRLLQRYRKCVINGEAKGWNPIVFGIFLSIHSVPVREGLLQFGTQTWNGFINGIREQCGFSESECSKLLNKYVNHLPRWIEDVVVESDCAPDTLKAKFR
jgi:urease accessory protein UreF